MKPLGKWWGFSLSLNQYSHFFSDLNPRTPQNKTFAILSKGLPCVFTFLALERWVML